MLADYKKYIRPYIATFYDVCVKRTHLPVRLGCPFKLGNVIRCLDWSENCIKCIRMDAYCRDYTGIGRVR